MHKRLPTASAGTRQKSDDVRVLSAAGPFPGQDQAAIWLRSAMVALAFLASAAAVVSWQAQYRMVFAVKYCRRSRLSRRAFPMSPR